MNKEQFRRELLYQVSAVIVDLMIEAGALRKEDERRWKNHLIELYDPPFGRLAYDGIKYISAYQISRTKRPKRRIRL